MLTCVVANVQNTGHPDALAFIRHLCTHPFPPVRLAAVRGLRMYHHSATDDVLLALLPQPHASQDLQEDLDLDTIQVWMTRFYHFARTTLCIHNRRNTGPTRVTLG